MKLRPCITYIVFFDCFLAEHLETTPFDDKIFTNNMNESKVGELHNQGVCVWGCVCVCWGVFAYLCEDLDMTKHQHTKDSETSEDLYTRPRKPLAKNTENVMFYHLVGGGGSALQGLQWTSCIDIYIYEDTRVLGSISNSQGCVCVYGSVRGGKKPCRHICAILY